MGRSAYDILINGKQYLLTPGGYTVRESIKSQPRIGGASARDQMRADNWTYWGQSLFYGQGQPEFIADGPFLSGYGLDLIDPATCKVAKQLAQTRADAANAAGYVSFSVGTTRAVFLGKTDSTLAYSADLSVWTTAANAPAAAVTATSWGALKGTYYVGASNGHVYATTDGITYVDKGTGGPGTSVYILGTFKGKVYVGYLNKLFTFDGTSFAEIFAGLIDGTPCTGCVGTGGLWYVTQEPGSAGIFMTDSNQLHHIASFGSDFAPKKAVWNETLFVFGGATDDTNTKGQAWRLDGNNLVVVLEFGDETANYAIEDAIVDRGVIVWSAGQKTGLGIYDPGLNLFEDFDAGFYVGSTITSVAGVVSGIVQFNKTLVCGIKSQGIYKQTTPGTFKVHFSRFNGGNKNINKTFGFGEIQHSALIAGQSVTLNTTKDGTALDLWGTNSTAGATKTTLPAPASYSNPVLEAEISGDAAGSDLKIEDIALAFIETSSNPKRSWDLAISIEGSADQPQVMRDGTDNDRTGPQMLTALNALWNTVTTFEDIDGTAYTVIFQGPHARIEDEIVRSADAGDAITDLFMPYRIRLVQL